MFKMTLNKSVLVDETFNVLKALYKGISSFNYDDEAEINTDIQVYFVLTA